MGAKNEGVGDASSKEQRVATNMQVAAGLWNNATDYYANPIPHCACDTLTLSLTYVLSVLTWFNKWWAT